MSETFYTSCADVLALFQAQKDNLEALLDPQAGFAPRLRQLCEQQCVLHLPESVLCSFTFQVVGHSRRGKCDTRRDRGSKNGVQHMGSSPSNHAVRLKLFSSLAPHRNQLHFLLSFFLFFPSARKTEPPVQPSARALLSANPYTPTSALAQATMAASRTLSELVVVREWLHDTAPPPPRPDASTGYWRFTKHRVTQGRWTGNTGRAAENVVREMDPDAVVREAEIGRSLAGDDAVRALIVSLLASAGSDVFRAMIRRCRIPCLRLCALGILRTRSNFVVMRTNRGAPQASEDLFFSRGPQFVSFPPHCCYYSLTLSSVVFPVSHCTAIRCCGRR